VPTDRDRAEFRGRPHNTVNEIGARAEPHDTRQFVCNRLPFDHAAA
jgi:hypothetical protein